MSFLSSEWIFLLVAAICATAGGYFDLESRRIPNWLTAGSVVFGLALHLYLGGWEALGLAAAAGVAGGAVFFLFFAIGAMGAGDVKLMAAVSLIAGFGHLTEFFLAVALMGGLLALGLATIRGRLRSTTANVGRLIQYHATVGLQPHPELCLSNSTALRLPYAVAIAGGSWIVFAMLVWR